MTAPQVPPELAVWRLDGGGYIVQHGSRPYARETAESAALLVSQLLTMGRQSGPAATPVSVAPPVVAQQTMPVGGPGGLPQAVTGTVTTTDELGKQRRNLEKLIAARIAGGISDIEFGQHCREYCPQIDTVMCLDALDAAILNEPLPWQSGYQGPAVDADEHPERPLVADGMDQGQGQVRPQNVTSRISKGTPGVMDFGPENIASMVQDYVLDDVTGLVLPDGK